MSRYDDVIKLNRHDKLSDSSLAIDPSHSIVPHRKFTRASRNVVAVLAIFDRCHCSSPRSRGLRDRASSADCTMRVHRQLSRNYLLMIAENSPAVSEVARLKPPTNRTE